MEQEVSPDPARNERIAALAYEIYLEQDCPDGKDVEHWLEAERRLAAAGPPTPSTSQILDSIQTSS
jgi:DUF2934 family protein